MSDLDEIARRYVEIWNEKDDERRRVGITELWAADAEHYAPGREARGQEGIYTRITGSHESWVADGRHVFKALPGANGHHNAIRFTWVMNKTADDSTVSTGFDLVVLNESGLIRLDYQFID